MLLCRFSPSLFSVLRAFCCDDDDEDEDVDDMKQREERVSREFSLTFVFCFF